MPSWNMDLRCPACGTVLSAEALATPTQDYRCPRCWAAYKPDERLDGCIRLLHQRSPATVVEPRSPSDHQADVAGDEDRATREGEAVGWSIGERLRAARRAQDISIPMVSSATRISHAYLHGLEDDEPLDAFPGRTYARSFLREYARVLAMDEELLVRMFDAAHPDGEDDGDGHPLVTLDPVVKRHMPRAAPVLAILAAVGLVVLGVAGLLRSREAQGTPPPVPVLADGSSRNPSTHLPKLRPGPTRPDAAADDRHDAGAEHGIRVVMRILVPSWVEAVADGEVIRRETVARDSLVVVRAERTLELTLGNAGGVRLRINGDRTATGRSGQVVRYSLLWRHGRVTGDSQPA